MSDIRNDADGADRVDDDILSGQTVTNDAVAGETVLPGAGDGNDGPTGGSPREGEPTLHEEPVEGDIDLRDEAP